MTAVEEVEPQDWRRLWRFSVEPDKEMIVGDVATDSRLAVFLHWSKSVRLVALELGTGRQLWSFSGASEPGPPYLDSSTVITRDDSGIHALDSADGKLKWSQPSAVVVGVHSGLVFSKEAEKLVARDVRAGSIKWTFPVKPRIVRGSAHMLYVQADQSGPSIVFAMDKNTGKELWRHRLETVGHDIRIAGIKVQVVVVHTTKESVAIEASTGRRLWALSGIQATSLVAGKGLVVVERGTRISEVDVETGEFLRSLYDDKKKVAN